MPRYKNVLFVGTGGGNDIFSTTLAMLALREAGVEWDACSVAGVLSPFHAYRGLRRTDSPYVVTIPDAEIRRIVPRLRDQIEIRMVERTVATLAAAERSLRIDRVYGLRLTHGTQGLADAFRWLHTTYDWIVLVDVGGDILFRGRDIDPHVLSPMFDAMVLEAFCASRVPGILFEAGPGTDGELKPPSLRETLSNPAVKRMPLATSVVDEWERLFRTHVEAARPGRTVPKTIEAFRSSESALELDYRARTHLGDRRWYASFPHRIDTELNRFYYLIPAEWARQRNPFCVPCASVLEWIEATQTPTTRTNGEFQFEYLELGGPGDWWLLALPSPLFTPAQYVEMLDAAEHELRSGNCRGLIVNGPNGFAFRTT